MIRYTDCLEGIHIDNLNGFFVGWPNPPGKEKHFDILKNSNYFWLAIDDTTSNVIGFITAISDNIISAYIPLLEVIPEYQGKGIGTELVKRMLDSIMHLYMIDLICDDNLVSFYERFNMHKGQGMVIRYYNNQNGEHN